MSTLLNMGGSSRKGPGFRCGSAAWGRLGSDSCSFCCCCCCCWNSCWWGRWRVNCSGSWPRYCTVQREIPAQGVMVCGSGSCAAMIYKLRLCWLLCTPPIRPHRRANPCTLRMPTPVPPMQPPHVATQPNIVHSYPSLWKLLLSWCT
jgi:hypothetical protein